MPAPSSVIEEILYDSLLGIDDPRQRAEFLDQTCQGNPELRARLEKLVDVQDRAERFFTTSFAVGPADFSGTGEALETTGDEGLGTMIGRYRLIERLGEGGCGAVYLAEQSEPVRRKVALKIIRVGFGTAHVIQRFEQERQAIALMDHPNIARVYDAGTTSSGRPFFVMQLVDGDRITDFCNRNRLGIIERIHLFISVCRAIQHAHQKGIIHCDIKPSNVLVSMLDGNAVPKVIDFGIARATEGETLTDGSIAGAQIIGTPAYMSPEQFTGSGKEIDTRSDIYSLGALLYELLSGKPPRDPERYTDVRTEEMRAVAQSEPPVPPSERLRACPMEELEELAAARRVEPLHFAKKLKGDLDAIVMKAMRPERRDRYGTASELATDLHHYLHEEPVNACHGGRKYRFRKLVRRNRIVFAAGTMVFLALVAAFGTTTWLLYRENLARLEQARLRQVAEQALANEAKLREKAQAGELVAHAAVLLNRGETEQADRILASVEMDKIPSTLESASTYRTIAEWHLREGRWDEAARRFAAVAQAISRVDKSDAESVSIHFVAAAAAVADAGDIEHYEELRQMAAERFSGTSYPQVADEVVKACLIKPADPELLAKLEPLIQVIQRNVPWDREDAAGELMEAWQTLSMALAMYRKGDYAEAERWAKRSVNHPHESPPRNAAAHAILAMASHQLAHHEEASGELEQAKRAVDGYFTEPIEADKLWSDGGFWFDWLIARLLLREAEAEMGS
ncbi:MAG: serine/threonine protein kinase [Akkermansiaceae bacterium]|nr:serine/threonine protein kinase [Akkermansiaceae bacterium]